MVADPASKKPSTVAFAEIVGQEDLKQVLLLAAAHDDLSGAVITGEKGTAKSTAVRGLVDLLGDQQAVADCPYRCDPTDPTAQCADCRARPIEELPVETRPVPLVTLPLGATRDRVVGTLSIEDAMAGDAEFDPGLLARANRGILYVDEVNLLDDHLVDVLLDAAASGVNTVERDGISVSHPAEFTLVGTMNPEEGDLRPQLRDRFDLQATVTGSQDIDDRVAIIDRALGEVDDEGESDEGEGVCERTAALRESLRTARESVDEVALPDDFKRTIADLCAEAGVDGHRADIATARAAIALAALDGRPKVIESDMQEVARYTLPHRLQSQPFEEPPDPEELLDDYFDDNGADGEDEADSEADDNEGDESESTGDDSGSTDSPADDGDNDESTDPSEDASDGDEGNEDGGADSDSPETGTGDGSEPVDAPVDTGGSDSEEGDDSDEQGSDDSDEETEGTPLVPGQQRAPVGDGTAPEIDSEASTTDDDSGEAGRRGRTTGTGPRGTRVRTERSTDGEGVDATASIRAAAASGHDRVEREDLRQSVRERETAARIVFAVDASASMAPAMEAAKGVVLDLLRDAYQQRDEVAFVAFGGNEAEVLLPPTRSVSLAARHLKELPTGDRTPLPDGLIKARQLLAGSDTSLGVVVLVTDGRATVADGSPTASTRQAAQQLAACGPEVVIVDASADGDGGLIPTIAAATDARTVPLSKLLPETVSAAVGRATNQSRDCN